MAEHDTRSTISTSLVLAGFQARLAPIALAVLVCFFLTSSPFADLARSQSFPDPFTDVYCYGLKGKKSAVDGYAGYLWGYSDIRYYDASNSLTAPARKEISLNSPVVGAQFETFQMKDLAIRAQAWINRPTRHQSDFLFSRNFTPGDPGLYSDYGLYSWDTETLMIGAGASVVYHLGLGGTPYTSGVIAGYRYNYYDSGSQAVSPQGGDFQDRLDVHIPYVGVYYAHGKLLGSVMRFEFSASPVTLALYKGERRVEAVPPSPPSRASVAEIDGHSYFGAWYEALYQWSWQATSDILLGLRVKYNYFELSGAGKIDTYYPNPPPNPVEFTSTAFSMDSRHHFCTLSVAVSYAF